MPLQLICSENCSIAGCLIRKIRAKSPDLKSIERFLTEIRGLKIRSCEKRGMGSNPIIGISESGDFLREIR